MIYFLLINYKNHWDNNYYASTKIMQKKENKNKDISEYFVLVQRLVFFLQSENYYASELLRMFDR